MNDDQRLSKAYQKYSGHADEAPAHEDHEKSEDQGLAQLKALLDQAAALVAKLEGGQAEVEGNAEGGPAL